MICRSTKPTGNTTGRSGGGPTITRAFPTWGSDPVQSVEFSRGRREGGIDLKSESRAGESNLRPLASSFGTSVGVEMTGASDVVVREPELETADRAVVPEVRARLRRIVAGEDNRYPRTIGHDRLRVIHATAEKIRVVAIGRHPGRHLSRRQHIGIRDVDQRAVGRI